MMRIAGEARVTVRQSTRWIVAAIALLVLALGAWSIFQYATEVRAVATRLVRQFRGPALPAGFASGNGRIEATEYDIATKRPGRIAAVTVREGRHGRARTGPRPHGHAGSRRGPPRGRGAVRRRRARTSGARSRPSPSGRATCRARWPASPSGRAIAAAPTPRWPSARAAWRRRRPRSSSARASWRWRRKELQRSQSLYDGNLIARQKLDEDLTRVETAEAGAGAGARRATGSPTAPWSRPRPRCRWPRPRCCNSRRRRESAEATLAGGEDRRRLS